MDQQQMKVLLAGNSATRSPALRKWLRNHQCQYQLADSFEKTCRLLCETAFDLVLCQYELRDRAAFPLLDWLEGTHTSLMLSSPSTKAARWLPVIEQGTRCVDRPLLRTRDLPSALEKLQNTLIKEFRQEKEIPEQPLQRVGAS